MFNIADYLKKFARIEGDSLAEKEAIQSVLNEVCGIDKADFEVKKGIIAVKGSPVIRSMIFTRKALILDTIRARSPRSKIFDIR